MTKSHDNESEEKLDPDDDFDATEESDKDDVQNEEREIPKLKEPKQQISKKEWDEVIKENFPDLHLIADIVLAGFGQLLIKDIINPFGLILVDKPASGKTLVLNFFSDIEELVYADDNFSPASFVSHAANITREKLADVDLLPKIKDKALLVREMAPIFGKHEDQLLGNMSILTRVFDGEGYLSSSGVHSRRGYTGTFMFVFLGASTPIRPRVWKTMSTLGSRLFFVNVGSKEKDEEALTNQLLSGPVQTLLAECKKATSNLIRTIWEKHPNGIKWDKSKTERKYINMISKVSILLAKFRGSVSAWETSESTESGSIKRMVHNVPEIEHPNRIAQILYNFAQGHAVVNGRDFIDGKDIKATLKVALESAPYHRTTLFKALIRHNGKLESDEVQEILNMSRPIALRDMEHLVILSIADKTEYGAVLENTNSGLERVMKTTIKLKKEFEWLLKVADQFPDLFQ